MNKYNILWIILLIFGCKEEPKLETITISSNELKEAVSFLASDELQGREAGSVGIDKAATYIENQFKSFGVAPYFDTYRNHFEIDSINAFNVVGFLEGTDDTLKNEILIIGAHYDHVGFKRKTDSLKRDLKTTQVDTIGNGANDNATGTAMVLATAKYFGSLKTNKRSILFALFSAEEKGLLGSKHLAEVLKSESLDLYTMINFEMVGVPLKDLEYTAFITGYERSSLGKKLNQYLNKDNYFGISEVSKKYQLFKRSDNYPFYQKFNVPCHSISTCDLNNFDYYHHVDDEISELNFEFMADLINQTIPAIETMSNTPTKEIKLYEE